MFRCLYISFLNDDTRLSYKKKIHSQTAAISGIEGYADLIIMSN